MFSSWAYILIGNNNTGKTSFQKALVAELCGGVYERLPRNLISTVSHLSTPRKLKTMFTCNRSYQEKADEYVSIRNYFESFFRDADICFCRPMLMGKAGIMWSR